jgi:hypothetical protein
MREGLHLDKCSLRFLSALITHVCGECRRNYIQDLGVPGSSPGRAFTGAIAQRAEHQTRSRGLFLHFLSPQRIAMAPGFSACREPWQSLCARL